MFKCAYLKQLHNVQARMITCRAAIDTLSPPEPKDIKIVSNMRRYLDSIIYGLHPNLKAYFKDNENETLDYLRQLGEYFINVADYEKNRKAYNSELHQLLAEERALKKKLGIF